MQTTVQTFAKIDPATGERIAEIPVTSPSEVHAAIRRAREASETWAALPFGTRAELLIQGGELLKERAEEVARLVTLEMGKVFGDALREAKGWAGNVSGLMEEVARACETEVLQGTGTQTHLVREPHGVVAAITPWNFPVGMPLEIVLPALAAGNTVVFKPSEHVPQTGAALAEIFGGFLPDGVLELVQGDGSVGAELVAGDIDMVGFVGSRATGIRIMESAAKDLKRLVLELGGKDPLIVFADADLEEAAEVCVKHSLRNTGQVCCSVERVYVAESVAGAFEALVVERAREWNHGSGFEDGVKMGPMVSAEQRAKVEVQVKDAVQSGARLLLGGETPQGPGYFYPATVLADVGPAAAMSREETFGPVVSLTVFDGTEEAAIRLANDTPYGLGANVFTRDTERAMRVARSIRSGQVGINQYLGSAPGAPWVGARQSGFGYLGGLDGHRQFTVPKSISFPTEPDAS